MKTVIAIALSCLLCASAAFAQKAGSAEDQIKAVFQITADGWNHGDLSKYLYAYVPDATEMLATGPTGGVDAIEKTMKRGSGSPGVRSSSSDTRASGCACSGRNTH